MRFTSEYSEEQVKLTMARSNLDSGFGSLDRPSLGSLHNKLEVGGGPILPILGSEPDTFDTEDYGDQAYASLGDEFSHLASHQLTSLLPDNQNSLEENSHFQDEHDNTAVNSPVSSSLETSLQSTASTGASSSITGHADENECTAAAQLAVHSTQPSDTESESQHPVASGVVGSSVEGDDSHECIDATMGNESTYVNRHHDMDWDNPPSPVLANVTAQSIIFSEHNCKTIIIRGSVMENRPEVISERELVELRLSQSPK